MHLPDPRQQMHSWGSESPRYSLEALRLHGTTRHCGVQRQLSVWALQAEKCENNYERRQIQ